MTTISNVYILDVQLYTILVGSHAYDYCNLLILHLKFKFKIIRKD